jgi:hypothetical protein
VKKISFLFRGAVRVNLMAAELQKARTISSRLHCTRVSEAMEFCIFNGRLVFEEPEGVWLHSCQQFYGGSVNTRQSNSRGT